MPHHPETPVKHRHMAKALSCLVICVVSCLIIKAEGFSYSISDSTSSHLRNTMALIVFLGALSGGLFSLTHTLKIHLQAPGQDPWSYWFPALATSYVVSTDWFYGIMSSWFNSLVPPIVIGMFLLSLGFICWSDGAKIRKRQLEEIKRILGDPFGQPRESGAAES